MNGDQALNRKIIDYDLPTETKHKALVALTERMPIGRPAKIESLPTNVKFSLLEVFRAIETAAKALDKPANEVNIAALIIPYRRVLAKGFKAQRRGHKELEPIARLLTNVVRHRLDDSDHTVTISPAAKVLAAKWRDGSLFIYFECPPGQEPVKRQFVQVLVEDEGFVSQHTPTLPETGKLRFISIVGCPTTDDEYALYEKI